MTRLIKLIIQLGGIAALTVIGTAWTFYQHPKRPALYLMAPERRGETAEHAVALDSLLTRNEPLTWIDARPSSQYEEAHIPGALSIRPDNAAEQLVAQFELLMDPRKTIVVYGEDADVEAMIDRLRSIGLPRIFSLQGGWRAWEEHQKPSRP